MATMSTAPRREYRVVTVYIKTGSQPSVDLDPVNVSIGRKDVICWHCEGDHKWQVDFGSDSPFDQNQFSESHCCSGPAKAGAETRQYKYTVSAGGETLDPGVIVDP